MQFAAEVKSTEIRESVMGEMGSQGMKADDAKLIDYSPVLALLHTLSGPRYQLAAHFAQGSRVISLRSSGMDL